MHLVLLLHRLPYRLVPKLIDQEKLVQPISLDLLGKSRSHFRPPLHTAPSPALNTSSSSPDDFTESDGQDLDEGPVQGTQFNHLKRIVINTLA